MSESLGSWFTRLYRFLDGEAQRLGWEKAIRDGDKAVLETLREAAARWMERNKPPGHFPGRTWRTGMPPKPGHLPSTAPSHLKTAEQIREEVKLAQVMRRAEQGGTVIRVGRIASSRRTVRGAANVVGMLFGLGSGGVGFLASKAGLILMSKIAARWYIEGKLIDYGAEKVAALMTAIDEACSPSTVEEAEAQYQGYLRGRHISRFNPKTAELIEWDDPTPAMSRDEWLAATYGLRWDALRR